MKIAHFRKSGVPIVGVDDGSGFVDYGSILESRGIRLGMTGLDTRHYMVFLLSVGALNVDFIRKNLDWVKNQSRDFTLNIKDLTTELPIIPGKLVCVARNWEDHAKEGGHNLPDQPIYFGKTANCAIGPGEFIPVPEEAGRVDHEGELGLVIGQQARRIKAKDAGLYIHSYTIVNDVTARAFQHKLSENRWPWYAAKSMDGFAPIGPYLVTPDEAEPLDGKRIKVTVNGEIRQDGSIDDMHWKPPELLEVITRNITLEPGDIVATGTPSGVGPIKPGDEVIVEIDGIGRLINPVGKRL